MKYEKMQIYHLKRDNNIDKHGRPVIYLDYFGDQSLVWCGTTIKNKKVDDQPVKISFNKKMTYFYNYNIEKVPTKALGFLWENKKKKVPYTVSSYKEKQLIDKFIEFTKQRNSYWKIGTLKLENKMLKKENEQLKKENQLLKQKEKEVLLREQELEDEYEYQ